MDKVKVIILHSVFTENAIVLATRLWVEIIKDFTPQTGYLYIVYGGHEKTIDLLNSQKQMGNTFGYIIMNSEPPNSQFIQNKFYLELMKNNVVFDYHNQSALLGGPLCFFWLIHSTPPPLTESTPIR